jgi:cell division protein FtsQ
MRALWHQPRLMHGLANALFGLALLGLIALAAGWLAARPIHTLRTVRIDAMPGTELRHVSSLLLGQAVRQRLSGSFFSVDLDRLRAGIEQVPWVRRATIRKVWPNRLEIAIEEHRALAAWGDGRLVNTFGELFAANLAEADEDGPLPQFVGPAGSELQVLERYEALRRWVAPLRLQPRAIALSPRLAWSARLDDGTRLLLGREQGVALEERVARWVDAHPRVAARIGERIAVVDLRYPNGFALRVAGAARGGAAQPDPEAELDTTQLSAAPAAVPALALAEAAPRRATPPNPNR